MKEIHETAQADDRVAEDFREVRPGHIGLARIQRALERRAGVTTILVIALGAAVGVNLRYGLSIWAAQQWGAAFPYRTLLINVTGSFALGSSWCC